MEVSIKKECGRLTLYLRGELDDHAAAGLRRRLDDILEAESMSVVIFDLGGVTFTDSTGIGLLIGRYKKLKSREVSVFLKNVSAQIEKIFRISGLFEIMPKVDEA